MVAQISADYPFFRGHARQGGRGLDYLGNCNPFIKNDIAPAAKIIAAPEIGEDVSGSKKLKTFAKDVGTKQFGKNERWKKENQA